MVEVCGEILQTSAFLSPLSFISDLTLNPFKRIKDGSNGLLAQLVARLLDMEEVTGSSPVETTNFPLNLKIQCGYSPTMKLFSLINRIIMATRKYAI